MALWWVERMAASKKRLPFGYGATSSWLMGEGEQARALYFGTPHLFSRRAHQHVRQTVPVRSLQHGNHGDISKVDCTLTVPLQMSEGPGKDGTVTILRENYRRM